MTVLEMQISVRQIVGKINSAKSDNLKPEEIDLELNRAYMRFINQRYGKNNVYGEGFEESQKRIDELRSLLTEYENVVFFKEELRTGRLYIDTFELPANYMYLVNQRSTIFKNKCFKLPFVLEAVPIVNYFSFQFENLLVSNGRYVDNLAMIDPNTQSEVLVWSPSPALLAAGYSPLNYPQYTQQLIDDILANPEPGFQIYYEYYNNMYLPGEFIVVVDVVNTYPWFEWDASINLVTPLVGKIGGSSVTTTNPKAKDLGQSRRIPAPSIIATKDQVLNRFSQQDDIYKLLEDPFNTTEMNEPMTTIRASNIDLYTNAMFIIESVKIIYIRKPRTISLSLGYDCELPDHTHQEIVAMTGSAILEEISDPRYKTNLGEVINRE